MQLYSKNHSNSPGTFQLIAKNGIIGRDLIGRSTGELEWGASPILTEESTGYRKSNISYSVGQIAYHSSLPTGWYLECTTAGRSSSGDLIIGEFTPFSGITDGTCVWTISHDFRSSGGIMIGDLIRRNADTSALSIMGGSAWNTGGYIALYGNDFNGESAGEVRLGVYGNNEYYTLQLKNNKSLLIHTNAGDFDLGGSAIVAKSLSTNGYIKYASGLILQFGENSLPTANVEKIVTFPISFSKYESTFIGVTGDFSSSTPMPANVISSGINAFIIKSITPISSVNWIAIGY